MKLFIDTAKNRMVTVGEEQYETGNKIENKTKRALFVFPSNPHCILHLLTRMRQHKNTSEMADADD